MGNYAMKSYATRNYAMEIYATRKDYMQGTMMEEHEEVLELMH